RDRRRRRPPGHRALSASLARQDRASQAPYATPTTRAAIGEPLLTLRAPPKDPGATHRDGHRSPTPRGGRRRGALRCRGPARVGSTRPAPVRERPPAALLLRRRHRAGQARSTCPPLPSTTPPRSSPG